MAAGMALSPEALDAVDQPIEQARGLPNACYTDPNFQETERAALFAAGWAAVGFGQDVANTGDLAPVDFLGMPLLLLRDRHQQVRVFHNVCRHRGYKLVQKPGHVRAVIRCPYHGWCYGLSGDLRATPSVGGSGVDTCPGFDRRGDGLWEVRAAVWGDIVFVNLDGQAEPFADYIASLDARWGAFAGVPLHPGGDESRFELSVATNWKLAVENFCESYHLPAVHPELNSYSRLEDHYDIHDAAHRFSGQGSLAYQPMLSPDGRSFPKVSGLSAAWDKGSEYIALYPNVLVGIHADHYYAIILMPEGVAQTRERVAIYYFDAQATGEAMADLRQQNARLWRQVFEEDIFVVEGMQAGRHSPAFDGGLFSPAMDPATHAFHIWAARRLRGYLAPDWATAVPGEASEAEAEAPQRMAG